MTARSPSAAAALLLLWGCAARHRAPATAVKPPILAPCGSDSSRAVHALAVPTTPSCPPPLHCPPPPDPRLANVRPGADTALWLSLDSLAQSDYLSRGGILGAWVSRLGDSVPVWSRFPDARLLPASTQKILTTSGAMALLGPSFRWRTSLWMTGSVRDGNLHGDLVLEGGGDPTFGSPGGPGLGGLAAAVQRAGIRRVEGHLIALDTLVGRGQDAWPSGWTIASSRDDYGAPVLGLNWNQNRIGNRSLPEPRPAALKALRKSLASRRILVTGTDTTVRTRGDSMGNRRTWTRLGTVASPALEPIVRECLKESVNPFAEAMMLGMGLGRRGAPRDAGRRRLLAWLVSRGMDARRTTLDDGCGLSRYDLVTARQMAQFLDAEALDPGVRLITLLPRGGQGTLRHRIGSFPDRSVLSAKTGTLDGVANLAGYLIRPGRDTLAFAFLCNGFTGSPRPVRLFQDRMLSLLSGLPLHPAPVGTPAPDSSAATGDDEGEEEDSDSAFVPAGSDSTDSVKIGRAVRDSSTTPARIDPAPGAAASGNPPDTASVRPSAPPRPAAPAPAQSPQPQIAPVPEMRPPPASAGPNLEPPSPKSPTESATSAPDSP